MLTQIKVLERDIAEGRPYDCARCPVALAFHRAGYPNAIVGARSVKFYQPHHVGPSPILILPDDVKRWIFLFDTERYSMLRPIYFEIDIPEQAKPARS